jgi:tRNA A-37 threonylcarbamoyl transferase component Bud32
MTDESRLLDLVVRWEELREAGESVTPEELCAECPELVEELRKRIQALAAVERVLDVGETQPMLDGPPSFALGLAGSSRPTIAGYEILEELGRGGMGVVYKARQLGLDRIVALKTILPRGTKRDEQTRRFLQEAKAMALLQHPGVVQIHEIGDSEGRPYLVMEYVGGGTLSEKLAAKPMPPQSAGDLVSRLARAVSAAHERGVIHRDLKPSNILLTAEGMPKIADFGLAKWFATPADVTETGHPLGTPSYMAPEQISSQRGPLGPTVDVYALGTILYELLTGHPPFLADNPLDTLQLVLSQEPVAPRRWQPKTPRDLETICLKCLEKDPRRRYATAQALADDLDRFLAGAPIEARPVSTLERGWRWAHTHRSVAALIGLALVATLTLLVVISVFNRRLAGQLERTAAEHRQVLATRERLDRALTQKEAEQLESDLRELAAVPTTVAILLEKVTAADEPGLEQMLRDLLEQTPLVFGMCVAFEPNEWQPGRADFALYVYRQAGKLAKRQLLPPSYQPFYRECEWYRDVRSTPDGRWCEPYVERVAGRTPMVTFSAPIHRRGRFVGVVTADLATDYFRALRTSVDDLDLGTRGYYFVVTAAGKILAHREDRCEFPGPESDLGKVPMDNSFRELAARFTRETSGVGMAVDPTTHAPATFQFTRVPSANWTLVRVMP